MTLLGNHLGLYGWVAGGVFTFFLLEQHLHWHHCHRGPATHRPLGYLILIADGFHNLIDGLAIGAAFIASTELGLVTWLVLAAHEIPQELGDFGILIHAGWSRRAALAYNLAFGATVIVGGLIAWALAGHADTAVLLPFRRRELHLHRPRRPRPRTHHHPRATPESHPYQRLRRRRGPAPAHRRAGALTPRPMPSGPGPSSSYACP